MTRGYYVLIRTDGSLHPVYSPSDSYLSYLGLRLMKAFQEGTLADYILGQEKSEENDVDRFSISWIYEPPKQRNSNRYYYAEYGYVYDERNHTISIYNFGVRIATVNSKNLDKWILIAENDVKLRNMLTYDPDKLAYAPEKGMYARLSRMSLEEVQKLVETQEPEYVLLEMNHVMDVFYRNPDQPAWYWRLKFADYMLTMIAYKANDGKWSLCLQLPYTRTSISVCDAASETGLKRNLLEYVKQNLDALKRLAEICSLVTSLTNCLTYTGYVRSPYTATSDHDAKIWSASFKRQLEAEWEKKPWPVIRRDGTIIHTEEKDVHAYFSVGDIFWSMWTYPCEARERALRDPLSW